MARAISIFWLVVLGSQAHSQVMSVRIDERDIESEKYQFRIEYPVCNLPHIGAFNDSLASYLNEWRDSFVAEAIEFNQQYSRENDPGCSLEIRLRSHFFDKSLVSYCFLVMRAFGNGVPITEYLSLSYDLERERFFSPALYLTIPDSLVYSFVFDKLRTVGGNCFALEDIRAIPLEDMHISVEMDSLLFSFSADSIGPHGCGAPQVRISKTALQWRFPK